MFILDQIKIKENLWVLTIPLYHFISGQWHPGESLRYSEVHTTEAWWGTVGIGQTLLNNYGACIWEKR